MTCFKKTAQVYQNSPSDWTKLPQNCTRCWNLLLEREQVKHFIAFPSWKVVI